MSIMIWNHARKGVPMMAKGSHGSLIIRAMMIRQIYPNHPIMINGVTV